MLEPALTLSQTELEIVKCIHDHGYYATLKHVEKMGWLAEGCPDSVRFEKQQLSAKLVKLGLLLVPPWGHDDHIPGVKYAVPGENYDPRGI